MVKSPERLLTRKRGKSEMERVSEVCAIGSVKVKGCDQRMLGLKEQLIRCQQIRHQIKHPELIEAHLRSQNPLQFEEYGDRDK